MQCCLGVLLIQVGAVAVSQEMAALQIPFIERPPSLDDFPGMQPTPEISTMMTRVEGFVQREPSDGDPASQETVVFAAY